ncbi:MAG: phage tail protein [Solirubrobacteraceae bacterium]|jgi:phage tail-like protein
MPPASPLAFVVLDVPNVTQDKSYLGIFKGLTGLEVNFDVYEYREGGNNTSVHRLPGRMSYPNLVLSWGLVDNELLMKWFMQTQTQAQLQQITLTLASSPTDLSSNVRKFTFADAFPVRWSGPQLTSDHHDPENWGETLEIAHSGLTLTT